MASSSCQPVSTRWLQYLLQNKMILVIMFFIGWLLVKFTPVPHHETYSQIQKKYDTFKNRN